MTTNHDAHNDPSREPNHEQASDAHEGPVAGQAAGGEREAADARGQEGASVPPPQHDAPRPEAPTTSAPAPMSVPTSAGHAPPSGPPVPGMPGTAAPGAHWQGPIGVPVSVPQHPMPPMAQAAAPAPAAAATPARPGRFSRPGAWVAIVITVIGAIIGVTTLGQTLWRSTVTWPQAVWEEPVPDGGWSGWDENVVLSEYAISPEELVGVDAIEVSSESGVLDIVVEDVAGASLLVQGGPADLSSWDFWVVDGTLVVDEVDRSDGPGSLVEVTLVLPTDLVERRPDLSIDVGSGAFSAFGTYGAVSISLDTGAGSFVGGARWIDATVASGLLEIQADGAKSAEFSVGEGMLSATLTGDQPASVTLGVSLGFADLVLPGGTYAVSGGDRNADVEVLTSPDATSTLDLDIANGWATVSASDA